MLIDWFTVGAQIVNFLILIWLLKRYLFRPVLTAIDAREKDISSRRADAVAEQAQAVKEQEECKRQKEGLEQERRAMLKVVQNETKNERSRILQEATRDAEHLRVAREKELDETTANYQDELIRLTRREIISIVRKILTDLASAELENSAFDLFIRRLHASPLAEKIEAPVAKPPIPAVVRVRSAFVLSAAQQEIATKEIQAKFLTADSIAFVAAPELDLGFELIIRDQKISWNIDNYLGSFESHLAEFAKTKAQQVTA